MPQSVSDLSMDPSRLALAKAIRTLDHDHGDNNDQSHHGWEKSVMFYQSHVPPEMLHSLVYNEKLKRRDQIIRDFGNKIAPQQHWQHPENKKRNMSSRLTSSLTHINGSGSMKHYSRSAGSSTASDESVPSTPTTPNTASSNKSQPSSSSLHEYIHPFYIGCNKTSKVSHRNEQKRDSSDDDNDNKIDVKNNNKEPRRPSSHFEKNNQDTNKRDRQQQQQQINGNPLHRQLHTMSLGGDSLHKQDHETADARKEPHQQKSNNKIRPLPIKNSKYRQQLSASPAPASGSRHDAKNSKSGNIMSANQYYQLPIQHQQQQHLLQQQHQMYYNNMPQPPPPHCPPAMRFNNRQSSNVSSRHQRPSIATNGVAKECVNTNEGGKCLYKRLGTDARRRAEMMELAGPQMPETTTTKRRTKPHSSSSSTISNIHFYNNNNNNSIPNNTACTFVPVMYMAPVPQPVQRLIHHPHLSSMPMMHPHPSTFLH